MGDYESNFRGTAVESEVGDIVDGSLTSRIAAVLMVFVVTLQAGTMSQGQSQPPFATIKPELQLKDISRPLQDLTPEERKKVENAIRLIGQGQHEDALNLLASLTDTNQKNSTIIVLRAYLLLELGDLTGALSKAVLAEHTGAHAAYRCWFLAQVAFLAGNKPLCRREIKHLGNSAEYGSEAQHLKQMLDARD